MILFSRQIKSVLLSYFILINNRVFIVIVHFLQSQMKQI